MQLSVIVTNYKTPELLKLCLRSVREALKNMQAEVFVMDAESGEDTEFVAKEFFPEFKFVQFEKNIGYTALINAGLKLAEGDYILILNSDIILTEVAAQKLIDFLAKNEKVGIVGPQLLNLDNSIQDSCYRFFTPLTIIARRTIFGKTPWGKKLIEKYLMHDFNHKEIKKVDWLLGAAFAFRKKDVEKIGLMDRIFFLYFSDIDWCRRFWKAGLQVVYLPEVKMYHYHRKVSKRTGGIRDLFINRYTWIHIADAVKYFFKYRKNIIQESAS